MKTGDLVQFKSRRRGEIFIVVGKKRKRRQWKAAKVQVVRISDGHKHGWISVQAFKLAGGK